MSKLLLSLILLFCVTTICFAQSTEEKGLCTEVYDQEKLVGLNRNKWKTGATLRVRFIGGTPSLHAKVKQIVGEWEKFSNIKFKFIPKGTAEIRVAFVNNGRTWSLIGNASQRFSIDPRTLRTYVNKHGPSMNFGWFDERTDEDEFRRTILHEFGHALGCVHEHQSPAGNIPWNKPAVYKYYMDMGWTKADVESNIFAKYSRGVSNSSYDKESIMHYAIPAYLLTDPAYAVGWNRELSKTDIAFIGQLYPVIPPPVTTGEPRDNPDTRGSNTGRN
ncbi:hypothetical protein ACN9ML_18335 [Dyadobacter endophyticus]|uniref:hypothetical protein n=1 Tax=Dyadobacter endophyticus TaxID=1749036 RepID=UPI003CF1FFCD